MRKGGFLRSFRSQASRFHRQLIARDFRHLAITPNIDWQPLSGVLVNRFFESLLIEARII
jgi:hypothetical protein